MRNTIFIIFLLLIASLTAVWWSFGGGRQVPQAKEGKLQVGENVVMVELAETPDEWSRGLSGRDNLGEEEGMLFVSDEAVRRTFWMKGMRFPLDMLFIYQGKVVDIAHKVPTPSEGQDGSEIRVSTWLPAAWVLEVNSGWAKRHGVELGDPVELLSEE